MASDDLGAGSDGSADGSPPAATYRLCAPCLASRVRALTFGGSLEDTRQRSRAQAQGLFDFAALLRRKGHIVCAVPKGSGADSDRDGSRTVRFEDHDVMRLLAGHDDEAAKRFFANHLFAAERAQQVTNVELRAAEILRRGSAAGIQDADTGRSSRRAPVSLVALP